MPALDSCHQQIVNALNKAGWDVDPKPVFIRTPEISIFADIQAEYSNGYPKEIVVIEVKCFVDERNDLDELYRAIGQYVIYRNILRERQIDLPLYLANPVHVHERLFKKKVVALSRSEIQMKLIVIDIDREEI